MSVHWRRTSAYHKWRMKTIKRDKKCMICGSLKELQAHHIQDGSNHPKLRFKLSNSITLCRHCHTSFHTDYKKSFRYKTTRDDLENYIRIIEYVKSDTFGS